jgi:hypothetical protein
MHSCSERSAQALSTGKKNVPCARGFCGNSKRVARRHQSYSGICEVPLPATHCKCWLVAAACFFMTGGALYSTNTRSAEQNGG